MSRGRAAPLLSAQLGSGADRISPRCHRDAGNPSPEGGRSGRSSGVNSGLVAAGGLAAGDPPSLCGEAKEAQPLRQRSGQDDSTTAPCSGAPCSAYSATAPGVWPRPPKRSATPQASGRAPPTLGHAPKHPSIPQALNCASKRLAISQVLDYAPRHPNTSQRAQLHPRHPATSQSARQPPSTAEQSQLPERRRIAWREVGTLEPSQNDRPLVNDRAP